MRRMVDCVVSYFGLDENDRCDRVELREIRLRQAALAGLVGRRPDGGEVEAGEVRLIGVEILHLRRGAPADAEAVADADGRQGRRAGVVIDVAEIHTASARQKAAGVPDVLIPIATFELH